jgi:hypothetical protein
MADVLGTYKSSVVASIDMNKTERETQQPKLTTDSGRPGLDNLCTLIQPILPTSPEIGGVILFSGE